jgi:2-methylisocitrate lyase-like PEP mutase family enzyme
MGLNAGSISGAGLSGGNLGSADLGVMGMAHPGGGMDDGRFRRDGDTGYGNAMNVEFPVRGLECAGRG